MTELTGVWFDEFTFPQPVRFRQEVYPVLCGKTHVAQSLHAYRIAMQRIVDDLVMSGAEWNNPAIRACKPFIPVARDVVDGCWGAAHEAAHPCDLSHVLGHILWLRGLTFTFDVAAPL